jgi:DnaA family protein
VVPGQPGPPPELVGDEVLVLLDDAHRLDADAQQAVFALCVQAQAQGAVWAAAAPMPPVDLPLRDDLRTRLAWGQVHALQPLDEEQTRLALGTEAERRGMPLSPDVLNYLMSRLDRDLASLMRWIDRLDRYSLARGRALTVPLVRSMLQEPATAQDAE